MSMEEQTKYRFDLRTQEIQEVLGIIPHWMVRVGSFLLLTVLVMLLIFAWFIRIPQYQKVSGVFQTGQSSLHKVSIPFSKTEALHPGQAARFKFLAFPAEKYGILKGLVALIEPNKTDTMSTVTFLCASDVPTSKGFKLPDDRWLSVQIEITIENKRILSKLFKLKVLD
jgi:hypothetical protein